MNTERFWETGIHPITGYIVPSYGSRSANTKQNMERINKSQKKQNPDWGSK